MIRYSWYKSIGLVRIQNFHLCSPCYDLTTPEPGTRVKARSGQIGVKVPKRKVIPRNAVLTALKDSVAIDWLTNTSRSMGSIDMAPNSLTQNSQMLQASEHAKEAVRLVGDGTELLTKGWVWDGETKANLEPLKITEDIQDKGPMDELHDRMLENDLNGLSVAYRTMIENGTEISLDLREKVMAFACYNMAGSARRKSSDSGVADSFRTIVESSHPYTEYMYSVLLRCYNAMGNDRQLIQWFEEMLKHNHFPDKITVNGLLSSGRSTSKKLKAILLKEMKTRGYTPSVSAVMALFPVDTTRRLDSESCAALLSEFIEETKYCANGSQLQAYVDALGIAGKSLQDKTLMYALLRIINTFTSEKVQASDGYLNAMVSADRMDDYELAKEILESAIKHCDSIHVRLFSSYIGLLSRISTPEVFLENTVNYFGQVLPVDQNLFSEIVQACSNRSWPHLLPYVFSLFDFNLDANKQKHEVWLECALELYDSADEDSATQIANIAELLARNLSRNRRPPTARYLNLLVSLLIKCKNDDGLNAILDASDLLSNMKYKEILNKCSLAIQNKSSAE